MLDFDRLLNPQVVRIFGEGSGVLLQCAGFPDQVVGGIYDSRYFALNDNGEIGGSTLVKCVSIQTSTVNPAIVDAGGRLNPATVVTVRGVAYAITDQKPDGQGMTVVYLENTDA